MSREQKEVSECIILKVEGQDSSVVKFKIKKHTPLKRLMNDYCDRVGLFLQITAPEVRFLFDGQHINEKDTPTSLEMEDGDIIEAWKMQTGGDKKWSPF